MRPICVIMLLAAMTAFVCDDCKAQARIVIPPLYGSQVIDGDTLPSFRLARIPVYSSRYRRRVSLRKYERLVRAVRLVYPMAQEARELLAEMETVLPTLPTKKEREAYVKSIERDIKTKYTPILRKMSMYQGMVLVKLIDRQTGRSSYALVQEFRGRFSAFFWHGLWKKQGIFTAPFWRIWGRTLWQFCAWRVPHWPG